MPSDVHPVSSDTASAKPFAVRKARTRFFGLTLDECIRVFFGGNAFVAVIVLALITFFLFREGSAFFGQNRESLRVYRQAGLEYIDIIRQQEADHTALTRYLFAIRMEVVATLRDERGAVIQADLEAAKNAVQQLADAEGDATSPALVSARARLRVSAARHALRRQAGA